MFLFNFIPAAFLLWVVNAILLAGIVGTLVAFFFGFFIRYMPWLLPHRMILQVASLVLLLAGVYFKGGISVEMEWRERVAEMEAKVAKVEAESKVVNTEIQTKIIEKIKVVKEKEYIIQDRIVNMTVNMDKECRVIPEALNILNDAAKNPQVKK
jgi:hypothetical protein